MGAIKLTGSFTSKVSDVRIKTRDKKVLEIYSSDSSLGENNYIIPAKISGDNIELAFNWRYLLDGVKTLSGKQVNLGLNNGNKAALIKISRRHIVFLVVVGGLIAGYYYTGAESQPAASMPGVTTPVAGIDSRPGRRPSSRNRSRPRARIWRLRAGYRNPRGKRNARAQERAARSCAGLRGFADRIAGFPARERRRELGCPAVAGRGGAARERSRRYQSDSAPPPSQVAQAPVPPDEDPSQSGGSLFRVVAGTFKSESNARIPTDALRHRGYEAITQSAVHDDRLSGAGWSLSQPLRRPSGGYATACERLSRLHSRRQHSMTRTPRTNRLTFYPEISS